MMKMVAVALLNRITGFVFLSVLYGSAPLWSTDRDRWEGFKNTFVQSYQAVGPWLQQIGYDELVSHRFVSADRTVQESVF